MYVLFIEGLNDKAYLQPRVNLFSSLETLWAAVRKEVYIAIAHDILHAIDIRAIEPALSEKICVQLDERMLAICKPGQVISTGLTKWIRITELSVDPDIKYLNRTGWSMSASEKKRTDLQYEKLKTDIITAIANSNKYSGADEKMVAIKESLYDPPDWETVSGSDNTMFGKLANVESNFYYYCDVDHNYRGMKYYDEYVKLISMFRHYTKKMEPRVSERFDLANLPDCDADSNLYYNDPLVQQVMEYVEQVAESFDKNILEQLNSEHLYNAFCAMTAIVDRKDNINDAQLENEHKQVYLRKQAVPKVEEPFIAAITRLYNAAERKD